MDSAGSNIKEKFADLGRVPRPTHYRDIFETTPDDVKQGFVSIGLDDTEPTTVLLCDCARITRPRQPLLPAQCGREGGK